MNFLKKLFLSAFIVMGVLNQQALAVTRAELQTRLANLLSPEEMQQVGNLAAIPDALLPLFELAVGQSEEEKMLSRNVKIKAYRFMDGLMKKFVPDEQAAEVAEEAGNWKTQLGHFAAFGPALSGILFLIYKYNLASIVFTAFTGTTATHQMGVILNAVKSVLPFMTAAQPAVALTVTPFIHVTVCALICLLGTAALYKNIATYATAVKAFMSLLLDAFMCVYQPVRDLVNDMISGVIWTIAAARLTGRGIAWGLGGLWSVNKVVLGTGFNVSKFVGNGFVNVAKLGLEKAQPGFDKMRDRCAYLTTACTERFAGHIGNLMNVFRIV